MSVHTAKGLWSHLASDCGLRDHISKVFTMHLWGIHTCTCLLAIRSLWTDENTTSEVCERRPGHVGAEREWENWYWWMIWYKMQHWTVWKINIFTGPEDIIRLIFLFTMLPPDARTTCGPFELSGFCGAHATTPTFLPPPPFISPGEAHWRIVTHSDSSLPLVGFAKHTELFAWAKKKKSLCLFHEDA